eukprot:CAMPEP_0202694782 /NCGR_PEP_ID=MMETSP1385-20130828/8548_1 /ASSEMBLY_ACC=CAM_ASM_000861 /TAXON_ID=933848 /ORGANISM="Elphidium margaritaceum" /LENGTH=468 /DNA_ID=CAMNT_0049350685 /DNA_START=35 /DNA_END=1441 /DNA_ORIENTATION=+
MPSATNVYVPDRDAEQPLLSPEKEIATETTSLSGYSLSEQWRWYHTMTVLCIRLIVDFVYKNPFVFYLDFEQGLNVSYMEFAYIMAATEAGCVFAIFLGDLNKKYMGSEENIMTFYLLICGVASILTPALSFWNVDGDNELYVIIWCCCLRFIVGVSFANISAASIKFASQYVANVNKITSIITVLHYSWPLSTVINIAAGYMITDSWMLVFVWSGVVLVAIAAASKLMFKCYPLRLQAIAVHTEGETLDVEPADDQENFNGLRVLLSDTNSLLIIAVSFLMSFRSSTLYIVTISLWMEDTFGLSADLVGWSTLTIIIGEVLALIAVRSMSQTFTLKSIAGLALSHQLAFGIILLVLATIFGNDISLIAALLFTAMLTMGHQSFYVVQQSNAIHYAPSPRLAFLLLLAERSSQEAASIIALVITVGVWIAFADNAILVFSALWIGCSMCMTVILFIYRSEPTVKSPFQ